jgi:uncharacterized protein YndB with AHSA1/START domain
MVRTDEEYRAWWAKKASWEQYEIVERVAEEVGWADKQKDLAESFLDQMKAKKVLSPKQIKIIWDWADRQRGGTDP